MIWRHTKQPAQTFNFALNEITDYFNNRPPLNVKYTKMRLVFMGRV